MTKYLTGVKTTLDYMDDSYNNRRMEQIQITVKNQPFVDSVKRLASSNISE